MRPATVDELHGVRLYGDDFSRAEIDAWFEAEKRGYYDLAQSYYQVDAGAETGADSYDYEYYALNKLHAFDFLARRHWETCLALGCASGEDVAPLSSHVDRFVAVEPAEDWWRPTIGGKPATYLSPQPSGDLPVETGSVDLAISLGVLHHIPNVSHVIGEVARTLRRGGMFVLREPIVSMGDWRKPRRGLTKHERGLPLPWLDNVLAAEGFTTVRRRYCMSPAALALGKLLRRPFNNPAVVMLDWLVATGLSPNYHYWRDTPRKKFAPSSIFVIAERVA